MTGNDIGFGLERTHPVLAEYDRYVVLGNLALPLGQDTGGAPDIRLYATGDQYGVVTIDGRWIAISAAGVLSDRLESEGAERERYLGKARFSGGEWSFVPAQVDEYESPYVLKTR